MQTERELIEYAEASISVSRDELIDRGTFEVAMYAFAQHKNKEYSIIGFGDPFNMIADMGHDAFRDQFFESIAETVKKEKIISLGIVSIDPCVGTNIIRVAVESKSGQSLEVRFEYHIFEGKLLLGSPQTHEHQPRVFR